MREYTADEQRVCDYLQKITDGQIGCGDDPIGFLIASHNYLRSNRLNDRLLSVEAEQCIKPKDLNKVSDFNL